MTTSVAGLIRIGLEHERLDALLQEADKVSVHLAGAPGPGCLRRAEQTVNVLCPQLLEHIEEEETDIYPVAFPDDFRVAVDLLVLDHERIRGSITKLQAALADSTAAQYDDFEALRRALVVLVTLVRAHHDKESFLYVRAMEAGADEESTPRAS